MASLASDYGIELWTRGGKLLADLSGRASNRSVTKARNEADIISWILNMDDFENYCNEIKTHPRALLVPGQTEARIKYRDTYFAGGVVDYAYPQISATRQNMQINASGFFNLFGDRYTGTFPSGTVTEAFSAIQATTIATTLMTDSQALNNGNFGITMGTQATVGTHDRNYSRKCIKDAITELTNDTVNPFDFEFTPDKVFKTYQHIGVDRPDILLEFPNNIIDFGSAFDATGIANEIIALGAGIGDQAGAERFASDTISQGAYALRQKVITSNGTNDADGAVTAAASSELAGWSLPFEIPDLKIDGSRAPFITDFSIGDRVRIKFGKYKWFDGLIGVYRIEKYTIDIDDNDAAVITVYLTRWQ